MPKQTTLDIIENHLEKTDKPLKVFIQEKNCFGKFEMVYQMFDPFKVRNIFSFCYIDNEGEKYQYVSKSLYDIKNAWDDGTCKLCVLYLYEAYIEGKPERVFRVKELHLNFFPRNDEENDKYWHLEDKEIQNLKKQYAKLYRRLLGAEDHLDPWEHEIDPEVEAKQLFGEEVIEGAKKDMLFSANLSEAVKKYQETTHKSFRQSTIDILNNKYSTFYFPDLAEWKTKYFRDKSWEDVSDKEFDNFMAEVFGWFSKRRDAEEVCHFEKKKTALA